MGDAGSAHDADLPPVFAGGWTSDTLWWSVGGSMTAAVLSFVGFLAVLAVYFQRRRHRRALTAQREADTGTVGHRRGSATLDFVLTLPIAIILFGLVIQFLLFAQNSLYLHHAAYAAARSARVHLCPDEGVLGAVNTVQSLAGRFDPRVCDPDQGRAFDKIDVAARTILVAASPSNNAARERQNDQCRFPTELSAVMAATLPEAAMRAFENKACYAFEASGADDPGSFGPGQTPFGGNVRVVIEFPESSGVTSVVNLALGGLEQPRAVTAEVQFKYPLVTPIGVFLMNGRHAGVGGALGARWRLGRAQVTLL